MERKTLSRTAPALMAAALLATGLTSCDTARSLGSAAAKPFKAAGQAAGKTAKKANPMRLLKRNKDKGEPAAEVEAQLADGADTSTRPVPAPTRNTATPGAQPIPGTQGSRTRSTLSLPSRPEVAQPQPRQPAINQPIRQPELPPLPKPQPQPTPSDFSSMPRLSTLDEPTDFSIPPVDPGSSTPPLSDPAPSNDDGFIRLTPKLPGEEDILPPE